MVKNLYIKKKKDLLDPEEVLLDGWVKEAEENQLGSLEWPISPLLIKSIFIFSLFLFAIVFFRAFYVQVVKGEDFQKRAENNKTRCYTINAPRGIIYDRFGIPLVLNSSSFSLVMIPVDLPKSSKEKEEILNKIISIFNLDKEELNSLLNDPLRIGSFDPILIKTNLSLEEVRRFETSVNVGLGFNIISDYSRYYPYGDSFVHVLGYIGKISSQEISQYKDYPLTAMIGKDGLEAYYERDLQGKPGKRIIEVDAALNIKNNLGAVEPEKGQDIVTTLDKDLQEVFYNSLKERMEQMNSKGAAGIALNPKTGEILSLFSLPSFDPNLFTSGFPKDKINQYLNDESHPLFNRATNGVYPVGSLIKPLIALAALEEKVIDPNYKILAEKEIVIENPYHPGESYIFKEWQNHGWVDMRKALAVSSNIYFWTIGGGYDGIAGLGLERIKKYWLKFGFDKAFGIDLPTEGKAILPDAEWLKKNRPDDPYWRLGDTYNIAVGEGGFSLTPLKMVGYISSIANNGILMKPHLVREIKDINGNPKTFVLPEKIVDVGVSLENLGIVQEGMREVVKSGTGIYLNDLPIEVAAKSGSPKIFSLSNKERYHAILGVYAPYEDPEIAILILMEDPDPGASATLPVAHKILNWYYENRIKPVNKN